jgi:hypothetical protein
MTTPDAHSRQDAAKRGRSVALGTCSIAAGRESRIGVGRVLLRAADFDGSFDLARQAGGSDPNPFQFPPARRTRANVVVSDSSQRTLIGGNATWGLNSTDTGASHVRSCRTFGGSMAALADGSFGAHANGVLLVIGKFHGSRLGNCGSGDYRRLAPVSGMTDKSIVSTGNWDGRINARRVEPPVDDFVTRDMSTTTATDAPPASRPTSVQTMSATAQHVELPR